MEVAAATRSHGLLALGALLVAPWLVVTDGFTTILVAPSIQDQLGTGDAGIRLIVAARPVAYAAFLVAGGRIGDVHGRRGALIAGLTLFSLSSALAAAAPNEHLLVAARGLQGVGAAAMYPQVLALLRVSATTTHELARVMAAWGVVLGMASGTAQLVGGLILQANPLGLGWRAVFAFNVPVGIAGALAVWRRAPDIRSDGDPRLDLVGAGLLVAALSGLVFPLAANEGHNWPISSVGLLVGAVGIALMFVIHERRVAVRGGSPLLTLSLLRAGPMLVGLVAAAALYGGQLSTWLLLTLYLRRDMLLSPLATGLVFTPVSVGFLAASTCASRLPASLRRNAFTAGALGLAVSTLLLSALASIGEHAPLPLLVADLLVIGVGFGLTIPTLAAAVLAAAPVHHESAASGLMLTVQQAAGALGVAVGGAITSASSRGGYAVNVLLFVMAAAIAHRLPR
jgi:MFS family permease